MSLHKCGRCLRQTLKDNRIAKTPPNYLGVISFHSSRGPLPQTWFQSGFKQTRNRRKSGFKVQNEKCKKGISEINKNTRSATPDHELFPAEAPACD